MYPVALNGRVVKLREFRSDDVADCVALVGNGRVTDSLSFDTRDMPGIVAMVERAVTQAGEEPRTWYLLAVTLDERLIGFAHLGFAGVKAAKLGYVIAADHEGDDHAIDVAWTLADFGFTALGLQRVSAVISPGDTAALRVAEHLGMEYEGRVRDQVCPSGAWRDALLYSVLRFEWSAPE